MKCTRLEIYNADNTKQVLIGILTEDNPLSFKFRTKKRSYEFSKAMKYTLRDTDFDFEGVL
jgi:hypothetical protein